MLILSFSMIFIIEFHLLAVENLNENGRQKKLARAYSLSFVQQVRLIRLIFSKREKVEDEKY